MHPDTLRKAGVGIKMAADAGMLSVPNNADSYRTEYIAKKQFYDQRREYNALLAREAREDHLLECLRKATDKMGENVPLLRELPMYIEPDKPEAVLVLTDWHYGMKADNIWNHYDVETCKKRVELLRQRVLYRLVLHDIDRLHVLVLGDMANGAIHVTSRVASEENVVEQLMHVSEIIAEFVGKLSQCVAETNIYCVYGNHMRTVQNYKDSIHADNMERIIPWWLAERFKDRDDVNVIHTGKDDMVRLAVMGNEICGIHGDLDNGKNSALILSQMYEKAYKRKLHYLFSGHFHTIADAESYGITSIAAGSLCGTDEFAKNARLFSDPSQTLAIFNADGLDALYHIKLR